MLPTADLESVLQLLILINELNINSRGLIARSHAFGVYARRSERLPRACRFMKLSRRYVTTLDFLSTGSVG
ncbi:hypothetical protein EVAR_68212_1 [Eumeta japonica]|uniref:Uncharacterized protein n=1 Tax=Eumeta variegata TaxID=151549 RepID=A0A4C1ZTM5_EUMVA|nr:hypothetical protein EVAR_68212_1 [Eumeta japonica]